MTDMTDNRQQRWGRLPHAVKRSGLSKGSLYGIAARHKGLFRKHGAATIVDLWLLDEILAALPTAELQETVTADD